MHNDQLLSFISFRVPRAELFQIVCVDDIRSTEARLRFSSFDSGCDNSTRKSWDPESHLIKGDLENEDGGDDGSVSTAVTYDESGDLILPRRHKRQRHSQSMSSSGSTSCTLLNMVLYIVEYGFVLCRACGMYRHGSSVQKPR